MNIRPILPTDRPSLTHILERIEQFRPDEVEVALELIDESLRLGDHTTYRVLVADDAGQVAGYVCFGQTPMTDHTYDLYWIVVDPEIQGRGVGKRLWSGCREAVLAAGGKIVRIETSSTELYGATMAFYDAIGFRLGARIDDFYRDGDALMTYLWRADR